MNHRSRNHVAFEKSFILTTSVGKSPAFLEGCLSRVRVYQLPSHVNYQSSDHVIFENNCLSTLLYIC